MLLQTTGVPAFAATSAARAKARAENPGQGEGLSHRAPVLLIHGRDDTVIPAESYTR
jgi:pimeloyl-ACP methyl ester carboxylesterase